MAKETYAEIRERHRQARIDAGLTNRSGTPYYALKPEYDEYRRLYREARNALKLIKGKISASPDAARLKEFIKSFEEAEGILREEVYGAEQQEIVKLANRIDAENGRYGKDRQASNR